MSPLFVNDYSFHGQFSTANEVFAALRDLRRLRETCNEFSEECFCSKIMLGDRPATSVASLRDVVLRHKDPSQKALVLAWLDKSGPFWNTARVHDAGDWYFLTRASGEEELATDSAVAECAARVLFDKQHAGLLSVAPSDFTFTPIITGIRDDGGIGARCDLPNHWQAASLRHFLSASVRVRDWRELSAHVARRFTHLVFAPDAFTYLDATPFSMGLRDRIIELLGILDRISEGTDCVSGELNEQVMALRESYFVGDKALFTDSSDIEKQAFDKGLTFLCPVRRVRKHFYWHGKIKMGAQYRIHFAWPKPILTEGLPVVYIGPKITKR